MKITKLISVPDIEVQFQVSWEDLTELIELALEESAESRRGTINSLNKALILVGNLPIQSMTTEEREITAAYLREQVDRFEPES